MIESLLELFFAVLWWVVLFPVVWLLVTPYILVTSFFGDLPYWRSVKEKYRKVTKVWGEWGLVIVP